MLTSRQRVFGALKREPIDRIPVDFWATQAVYSEIRQKLGLDKDAFLDTYDVDLRYIDGPEYVGPPLEEGTDIWGVRRTSVANERGERYEEVAEAPLAGAESPADVERYGHWPRAEWFNYSTIESQCDEIASKDRVVVFMGDRLNRVAQLKPAMYLRGAAEIFIDLAINQELAKTIFRRIRTFYLEYLARILEAAKEKIDIVLTGDDFGAQNGLILSRDMWHSYLQEGFEEYIDLIHSHNTICMHHSCGGVAELVPDFIDSGLDVLQSLQPEADGMDFAELYSRYGNRLAFQGGISIQKTMPFGTSDDIRDEVSRIADLVRDGGGYIFCTSHNIQSDTPLESVLALVEAYREFG